MNNFERDIEESLKNSANFITDDPMIGAQIFGWEIYMVFRDEEKNIIKIILHKNGIFKSFVHDGETIYGDEHIDIHGYGK